MTNRTRLSHAVQMLPRRATQLTLIPAAFFVHNAEEALTLPATAKVMQPKLSALLGFHVVLPSANQYYIMLALLTLAAFLLWLAAMRWEALCYGLVAFQATMALNVVNHAVGAILLGGYAAGVVTAVGVELVVTILVFRRLKRVGWMSRRQWVLLAPLALLMHGPLFYGALMLVARL